MPEVKRNGSVVAKVQLGKSTHLTEHHGGTHTQCVPLLFENMKTIIRIEDRDGRGMYCGLVKGHRHSEKTHPTAKQDSELWEQISYLAESDNDLEIEMELASWRFGFADEEQCNLWVSSSAWWRDLHSVGMHVAKYTCEACNVLIGGRQVVFQNPIGVEYICIKDFLGIDEFVV
jgi:hypothetical protein